MWPSHGTYRVSVWRLEPSDPGGSVDGLLYDNHDLRVLHRVTAQGGKLILKQAKSMQAIQRLARERSILERLASIAGVARLAAVPPEPNTLAL